MAGLVNQFTMAEFESHQICSILIFITYQNIRIRIYTKQLIYCLRQNLKFFWKLIIYRKRDRNDDLYTE